MFAIWSRAYSHEEYEKLSARFTVLFTSILSSLLLFLGLNYDLYFKEESTLVSLAVLCGANYVISAFLDTFFRFKVSYIRFFGEVSIVSGIGGSTFLFILLIEKKHLQDLYLVLLIYLIGAVLTFVLLPPKPEDRLMRLLRKKNIDLKLFFQTTLNLLAIYPERKETDTFYQNLLKRLELEERNIDLEQGIIQEPPAAETNTGLD